MRGTFLVLFVFCLCVIEARRKFPVPNFDSTSSSDYDTLFFDSLIDNFDPTIGDTFPVKYLVNKKSFKDGSPLFFYTGNEGTIEDFAANTGIMYDIAPMFNALIVFCEHRYYGNGSSLPYGEDSLSTANNAKYLTIEQTLADYVTLIGILRQQYKISSVIGFGGSYGGMLSAWFRTKYPTVVDGVWAASAPVAYFRSGKTPMGGFDNVVGRTMTRFGCDNAAVADAIKKLDQVLPDTLNTIFNVDSRHKLQKSGDIFYLKSYIREGFEYMAMTCYPYPANFLRPLAPWPMLTACGNLKQKLDKPEDAAQALRKAMDAFYDPTKPACFLPGCSDSATASLGNLNGWAWQSCTQIAIDICAQGGTNDPFWQDCSNQTTDGVPSFEDFFAAGCRGLSDPATGVSGYSTDMIQYDYIKRVYGFDLRGATNLILTQGYLDPWSVGGADIDKDDAAKREIYMYNIYDAAHHLDLRTPNTCDPPSVVAARYSIINILKKWTGQPYDGSAYAAFQALTNPTAQPTIRNDCKDLTQAYPWGFTYTTTANSQKPGNYSTTQNPLSTTKGLAAVQPTFALIGLLLATLLIRQL